MNKDARLRELVQIRAERKYSRVLLKLARQIGMLSDTMAGEPTLLEQALRMYALTVRPWAEVVGLRMLEDVTVLDLAAWRRQSHAISRGLREVIETTPVGELYRQRLADQVRLITSLPTDAADRVSKLAQEARIEGWTEGYLAAKIREAGDVTASHAKLIARTESARTSTELTRVRAERAGSTHYIWRSTGDHLVRPYHAKLDKTVHAWDDPPVCEPTGERAHPGCIWNCRCIAIPIFPEED